MCESTNRAIGSRTPQTTPIGASTSLEEQAARRDLADCQACDGICAHYDYMRPVFDGGEISYTLCAHGKKRRGQKVAKVLELTFDAGILDANNRHLREQEKARLARIAPRIRQKYGVTGKLGVLDICAIERAERELAACEGCQGMCRKETSRYIKPQIRAENGELKISGCRCKFNKTESYKAQIPREYAQKTFGDYEITRDNERAVGLAHMYIEGATAKGLYLYGGYGTGKTFLASLVASAFLSRGKSVIFGDVPELMTRIKKSFDGGKNPLDDYCECDLLILDDIGAGQVTEWNVGQLYQIINARYNAGKPIVATSNLDLEELAKRLGTVDGYNAGRITSRLAGMCTSAFLGIKDRRR